MKVIIAIDATPNTEWVARAAARRQWPARTELRLVVVVESPPYAQPPHRRYVKGKSYYLSQAEYDALETAVRKIAASIGTEGKKVSFVIREGLADDEIITEAKEWGADLIMVGTHGRRRFSRFLLGSVAQRVVATAPCSVEVVRQKQTQ